jgi:Tol biopolymer transport system component
VALAVFVLLPAQQPAAASQPAGAQLAWIALDAKGEHSVVMIGDEDGAGARRVDDDTFARHMSPTWSPDGRQLAYVATESHTDTDDACERRGQCGDSTVFVLDLDAAGPPRSLGGGTEPTWSPDGREVLFDTLPGRDLVAFDVGSGARRVLDSGPRFHLCPKWSPDGTMVVTTSLAPDGSGGGSGPGAGFSSGELRVIGRDGRRISTITTGIDLRCAAWSPDSTELAYEDGAQPYRLSITDIHGGNKRDLPGSDCLSDDRPVWSSAGLAFARKVPTESNCTCELLDPSCKTGVWLVRPGQDPVLLAPVSGRWVSAPTLAWSPDLETIAFEAQSDGCSECRFPTEIRLVDLDGSVRGLAEPGPHDFAPAFGPPPGPRIMDEATTTVPAAPGPTTSSAGSGMSSTTTSTASGLGGTGTAPTTDEVASRDEPGERDDTDGSGRGAAPIVATVAAIGAAAAVARALRRRAS